jgi:hypothetical protein
MLGGNQWAMASPLLSTFEDIAAKTFIIVLCCIMLLSM